MRKDLEEIVKKVVDYSKRIEVVKQVSKALVNYIDNYFIKYFINAIEESSKERDCKGLVEVTRYTTSHLYRVFSNYRSSFYKDSLVTLGVDYGSEHKYFISYRLNLLSTSEFRIPLCILLKLLKHMFDRDT